MRRTQLLLPPDLHRRATEAARARRLSLGSLIREALVEYLARTGTAQATPEAVREVLLSQAFQDPHPDLRLSADVDFYLHGAARRSRRRQRPRVNRQR
jgi:hypothetical protein